MVNTVGKYANPAYAVGHYAGGRVIQAAYGVHTQVANSSAADTLDITKLPGNALVLRAQVYVNGVRTTPADVTVGYVGALSALNTLANPILVAAGDPVTYVGMIQPVQLDATEPVTVRLTSVGASDFPAGAVIYALIEYVTNQPVP